MKKLFLVSFFLFLTFFLAGCTFPQFPWQQQPLGALQVTSVPKTIVFLDDKEVGKTPYYDEKLPIGEHTLRLSSDLPGITAIWQTKIKLLPRVLTVVSRDLGPSETLSSGHIISLEQLPNARNSEISVISIPAGAQVSIDDNVVGNTPVAQGEVKQGEHTVSVTLSGYRNRSIRVQTVAGYRLLLNVQLAQTLAGQPLDLGATGSAQPVATNSGQQVLPTPTRTTTISGLPSKPRIKVLDTPTGWLNVRSAPSLGANVVTKINPGEYYSYIEEQTGWVRIKLDKDKDGWVSVQYVEKQL